MNKKDYLKEGLVFLKTIAKYLDDEVYEGIEGKLTNTNYYYYGKSKSKDQNDDKKVILSNKDEIKIEFIGKQYFFQMPIDIKCSKFFNPICAIKAGKDNIINRDLKMLQFVNIASSFQGYNDYGQMMYWIGFIEYINESVYDRLTRTCYLDCKIRNQNNNNSFKYSTLNKALAEMIAKFITDQCYDEKYVIYNESYTSHVAKGYFILAHILLKAFEADPTPIMDAFFTNDIEEFEDFLTSNTKYSLDDLLEMLEFANDDFKNYQKYVRLMEGLSLENKIENLDVKEQFENFKKRYL